MYHNRSVYCSHKYAQISNKENQGNGKVKRFLMDGWMLHRQYMEMDGWKDRYCIEMTGRENIVFVQWTIRPINQTPLPTNAVTTEMLFLRREAAFVA